MTFDTEVGFRLFFEGWDAVIVIIAATATTLIAFCVGFRLGRRYRV